MSITRNGSKSYMVKDSWLTQMVSSINTYLKSIKVMEPLIMDNQLHLVIMVIIMRISMCHLHKETKEKRQRVVNFLNYLTSNTNIRRKVLLLHRIRRMIILNLIIQFKLFYLASNQIQMTMMKIIIVRRYKKLLIEEYLWIHKIL